MNNHSPFSILLSLREKRVILRPLCATRWKLLNLIFSRLESDLWGGNEADHRRGRRSYIHRSLLVEMNFLVWILCHGTGDWIVYHIALLVLRKTSIAHADFLSRIDAKRSGTSGRTSEKQPSSCSNRFQIRESHLVNWLALRSSKVAYLGVPPIACSKYVFTWQAGLEVENIIPIWLSD